MLCRQMQEQVSAFMKKYHMVGPGEKVLVALSGGADSVCLFHVLLALRESMDFSVEAVHVNHMLRESADSDEEFVRNLCREKGISLHVCRKDVGRLAKEQGMSLEEAGREARYCFFDEVARKTGARKIAVAHHANDRAETVLFRLCRGTGISGLVGIRPVRGNIIRPLLGMNRAQIEKYLETCGRTYVTDETNADNAYSRNRIRNEVLPLLEKVCPGATGHLAGMSDFSMQIDDYLKASLAEAMKECVDMTECAKGRITLFCVPWKELHAYMQSEVIRECLSVLAGSRKDIGRVHVEDVARLSTLQVGSRCSLPYGMVAQKGYDRILFFKKLPSEDEFQDESFCARVEESLLDEGTEVVLPDGRRISLSVSDYNSSMDIPIKSYTKWLDYDKIEKPLVIRTPREGDFFFFDNKNKKYVKDYMVNEKIPLEERKKSILIASESHMIYFVGRRISSKGKIDDTTKRILKIAVTEDKEDG